MYNRLWNRWSITQHYQRHFGCDKLTGAELEDQGEEGTALTHWEKRLFENEAMTGTHTQNPIYSRITMALMEDTGWYQPNYDMAEDLKWGRGLGCDFALKSCKVKIYQAGYLAIHLSLYFDINIFMPTACSIIHFECI